MLMSKKLFSFLFFVSVFMIFQPFCVFAKEEKEEDEVSIMQKRKDTLAFGLESEISELISDLIKEKDESLSDELEKLVKETSNASIREKIIEYFTENKDDRLKSYVMEILEDPYDYKNSTVNKLITYTGKCGIKEAAPRLVKFLDDEKDEYYDSSVSSLGEIGGPDEAVFLSELMERDLTTSQKQTLMKALGKIKAVETWDKLVEIAENDDENLYVRMYASEAIGAMQKEDSIPVLKKLFESSDPNLRTYALKGLSYYDDKSVKEVFIQAFRDNYYKVRLEAAEYVEKNAVKEALPILLYRAKNDSEPNVKYSCYKALGVLNEKEAFDFLAQVVGDTKKGETARAKAAAVILDYDDKDSINKVLEVTEDSLTDKKKIKLRYALGKEIALHENPLFEDICKKFLENEDSTTKGIGLDIWKKNNFSSLRPIVEKLAEEKSGGIKSKAQFVLDQVNE